MQLKINHLKFFCVVLFLLTFNTSCTMPEKFVSDKLSEKYQKEFEINSSRFSSETGNYHLVVSPADLKALTFQAEHNPKTKHLKDYYPNALWQFEGQKYFEEKFKSNDIKFLLKTGVSCTLENLDPLDIPSFKDLLDNKPEELHLNLFIHFFSDITSDALDMIVSLDKKLRLRKLGLVGFTVSFYKPSSVANKNIESLNFGFNAQSDDSFEVKHRNDFIGIIKYRIKDDVSQPPTKESLESIISDNPGVMVFKYL